MGSIIAAIFFGAALVLLGLNFGTAVTAAVGLLIVGIWFLFLQVAKNQHTIMVELVKQRR